MRTIKVSVQDRFNPRELETICDDAISEFKCPICKCDTWIKINYIQETPSYLTGSSICIICGNSYTINR